MASLHKQPDKPYWFAAFSVFDPQTGRWRRVFKSTKTRSKKQAHEVMRTWDRAARQAHDGLLTADTARAIIAQGVSEVLRVTKGESLPRASIKSWCESWLASKEKETMEGTCERYKIVVARFVDSLGETRNNRDVATLHSSDIAKFRDAEAKELALSTANLSLNIIKMCFNNAVDQGLLTVNPAVRVKKLKSSEESKRRAFTLPEIQRILNACGDDVEWKGLVLCGLYLGQRLGDLARLTWRAVDLENNEIAFTARKTGRRIVLPLVQPLVDYLSELPANDNPNARIFPNAAKHKLTAALSNQFHEILVEAGLIEPREHMRKPRRGRTRETSELSFHSLRHSATSMLKAAGVSDFMAMQIIGHESSAISRQYSHIATDDLRRAMERLPNVTASTKARSKRTRKG
jgi:integrase